MDNSWTIFESVARVAASLSTESKFPYEVAPDHPFDSRNIHPGLPPKVRKLFDDAHYSEAALKAFVFLNSEIRRHSGSRKDGVPLMQQALSADNPLIQIVDDLKDESQQSEQRGYKDLFAGAMAAIRNPRAHEYDIDDDLDQCLDYLSLASLLLRRLAEAGYETKSTAKSKAKLRDTKD